MKKSPSRNGIKTPTLFVQFFVALSTILFASGCMKQNSAIELSSQKATESLGCDNLKSKIFDSMYDYLENQESAPDLQSLEESVSRKIDQLAKKQKITDTENLTELKKEFSKVFSIMITDSKNAKDISSIREHVQSLIEMEMEDSSSSANIQLNSKMARQFSKINELSNDLQVQCQQPQATDPNNIQDQAAAPNIPNNVQERMIAGSYNVLTTAYQSCKVLEIPEISAETPNVVGIKRVGTHSDGVGGVREVSSVSSVQQTHPYIRVAAGAQNGCFNVRSSPLIYDYGGSPSVANNTLNFFKNSGSGSTALGVDCSAYVSAAVAAGGFRYKAGVDNKAIYVRQTAVKFVNPKTSGFSCFDNITVDRRQSIKPGDIAAVKGHVVMIDKIGVDPFGLQKLTNVAQCDKMDFKNFDFVISQSSPNKNGIGLNRFIARDYLKDVGEFGKMGVMFSEMGKAACKAYFQNTSIKPASSAWGIIRHNGKAECFAPRIQMAQQSCVNACQR